MSETGHLARTNMEKAKVLKNFFTFVFTGKCSSHATQFTESKVRDWKNKVLPTMGEDIFYDQLRNLKAHKSMGSDEMHPWVLRELVDEVLRLSHSPSYLRSCGSLVKFLLTGEGET